MYHQAIQDFSFGQILRSVAREVLQRCKILAGLAIVENAYDETARIVGVAPEEFEQEEPRLLQQARQWLPKLPFDQADMLLIDELGKDVSGPGSTRTWSDASTSSMPRATTNFPRSSTSPCAD